MPHTVTVDTDVRSARNLLKNSDYDELRINRHGKSVRMKIKSSSFDVIARVLKFKLKQTPKD